MVSHTQIVKLMSVTELKSMDNAHTSQLSSILTSWDATVQEITQRVLNPAQQTLDPATMTYVFLSLKLIKKIIKIETSPANK